MTSYRLSVANRQHRLYPRSQRTFRSPPSRPGAAKSFGAYRRALVSFCFSPGRALLTVLAVDFLDTPHRATSILAGYVPHAFPAVNMDSEDGELFIKVCLGIFCVPNTCCSYSNLASNTKLTCLKLAATCHIRAHTRKSLGQCPSTTKAECPPAWRFTECLLSDDQRSHVSDDRS